MSSAIVSDMVRNHVECETAKMSSAIVSDMVRNNVVRSDNVAAKHATKLNEMLNEIAKQHPNGSYIIPSTPSSASIIIPAASIQALPKCMLANYTSGDVNQQGEKSWAGSVLGAYPIRIAKNDIGGFRHRYVDGSEGALLYHGTANDSDITFVFAWKDTRGDNKVYVEAGPSEDYDTPSWDIIRNKLRIYGNKQSYYKDNGTGAETSAQIGNGLDFTAAAVFDVTTI